MIAQPHLLSDPDELLYPDSDGLPMADNTRQYQWIVLIKENLEILFVNRDVFIAGDLLWYPVQGLKRSCAPDVLVAFGRPKGDRGSYQQWLEDDIPPQVVFEILSPSNKTKQGTGSLDDKFEFYQRYGVEEYYIYDPDELRLEIWQRQGRILQRIEGVNPWISPRLGIRFEWQAGQELKLYRPDGRRFLKSVELEERASTAEQRATQAEQRENQERQRATQAEQRENQERQRAEQAEQREQQLRQKLMDLGLNPDQL